MESEKRESETGDETAEPPPPDKSSGGLRFKVRVIVFFNLFFLVCITMVMYLRFMYDHYFVRHPNLLFSEYAVDIKEKWFHVGLGAFLLYYLVHTVALGFQTGDERMSRGDIQCRVALWALASCGLAMLDLYLWYLLHVKKRSIPINDWAAPFKFVFDVFSVKLLWYYAICSSPKKAKEFGKNFAVLDGLAKVV